jgi:hypothetical protein
MTTVTSRDRALRVALLWNGTIQAEETLLSRRPVVLGRGAGALCELPENVSSEDRIQLLVPSGSGYTLKLKPFMSGDVWVAGARRNVRDLAMSNPDLALGPDDFGVVTIGPVAVFFQYVRPARQPSPMIGFMAALYSSIGLIASILLSLFMFTAFFLVMFLGILPELRDPGTELPPELLAQFLVTPPPPSLEETAAESGTNTEDPGLQSRDETGGRRHEGEEGRVGRENAPQEDTEIAGEQTTEVAARVRQMDLLGALSGGGEENAIAEALDIPNIGDILGGTGAATTILGRGSGGAGLRGTGRGGGGTGPGSLFGAGNMGTGIGAGRGGLGTGDGGIGVKGREREERVISVTRGAPQVNGYLSAEQINRVVRANQAAIRYCYEVEVQRQPNLRGRVSINWRINLAGAVTSARVASSSLNNASVEGCMTRQIRRWRFPQPDGGEVVVTYPFIFGVQGG